jgi:hypothetical protein
MRKWPADEVERWPIENIKPYERNPLRHTAEQVQRIVASMEQFGVTAPLLVDEAGELIYGHARLLAAKQLGYTSLPVIVARGWTVDEKRAYRIADNQLARLSEWEIPDLSAELAALAQVGFNMPVLGFSEEELKGFELSGYLTDLMQPDGAPVTHESSAVTPGVRGVQLRFDMMPEDRDLVVGWLSEERDKLELRTTAEALIAMAKRRKK